MSGGKANAARLAARATTQCQWTDPLDFDDVKTVCGLEPHADIHGKGEGEHVYVAPTRRPNRAERRKMARRYLRRRGHGTGQHVREARSELSKILGQEEIGVDQIG